VATTHPASAPRAAHGPERIVRVVDRFQQRHAPLAFSFAVVKKFGDDRGSVLAALFAYYGFLALFPLLLLLVTVSGIVLQGHDALRQQVLRSAFGQLPLVGDRLHDAINQPIRGHGLSLAIGVLGLVWGSLGIAQVGQLAMAEVWNVKGVQRPGFPIRLVRSLGLIGVLGLGLVVSTALAGATGGTSAAGGWKALALAGSLLTNAAVFVAAFRILTPKQVRSADLVPGAAAAGVAWTALQVLGGYLVGRTLAHASATYASFGVVLGLLSFLSLAGTTMLYAAEANVVRARRLWPRSIVQPPLTAADEKVLAAIATQEERRPEQTVEVTYEQPVAPPAS
jgi:YihY family inner membrane protein